MRFIKYLLVGIFFGILMAKSEAFSWYRIQEMFRFQAFHMYGIIGTAVVLGAAGVWIIKKLKLSDIHGERIKFNPKEMGFWRYFLGGTIFGLGWALGGACPGPMVVSVGYGVISMLVVFFFSVVGTFIYGEIRDRLPH
ncbi:MAG: YeeE/YedE thiosulfate transporter family protein [Schleiferiaceae bacterium]